MCLTTGNRSGFSIVSAIVGMFIMTMGMVFWTEGFVNQKRAESGLNSDGTLRSLFNHVELIQ